MYASETFGRLFWVDDNYEFKSCPLCVDGTGDFTVQDYVSEWDDWSDVDYDKLFNIHKFCILNKINYNNSLTHREAPVVNTLNKEDSMINYKWDEKLYQEIVNDSKFSYGKFTNPDYPSHLSQSWVNYNGQC